MFYWPIFGLHLCLSLNCVVLVVQSRHQVRRTCFISCLSDFKLPPSYMFSMCVCVGQFAAVAMPTNKEESDGEMEQDESSASDSASSHGSDTDTSDLDLDQSRSSASALICGPDVMMRIAADRMIDLGMSAGSIQLTLERNMQCATGRCGHCQLGPVLVCRDGPVVTYPEIADSLRVQER